MCRVWCLILSFWFHEIRVEEAAYYLWLAIFIFVFFAGHVTLAFRHCLSNECKDPRHYTPNECLVKHPFLSAFFPER